MSSASARKELNELGRLIRQNGFKLAPGKGGHWQILYGKGPKKGQKLVDDHGPVILSTTPSDFRARDLAAARLIRAGALSEDQLPWKPQKRKEAGDGVVLVDDEEDDRDSPAARKRLKQLTESRSRNERTQIIRARLEPIVTRLGGWGKRGMVSEMGDVLYWHSKDSQEFSFPSVQAAKANATSLRKGGTLSDEKATAWEALLDTLEGADVPRDAWFDMVRAQRGLPSRAVPVVSYQPGTIVEGEGPHNLKLRPEVGELRRAMEKEYGNGGGAAEVEPHPLYELHRDGGLRWNVPFTIDDLNELSRAVGFFEGLAVQLSFFDGQELVEPALEKIRALVEKVGAARFRELTERGQVAGVAK